MSSKSETGHAKNVANLGVLIVSVEGFGERYNPVNALIVLPALKMVEIAGRRAIDAINEHSPVYTRAIAERDIVLEPMGKLSRRSVNALKAGGAPQKTIDAARVLCNKINGSKKKSAKPDEAAENETADMPTPREISTAQTSIDGRIENCDKLIKLLEATPEYNPNEEELKTATLAANLKLVRTRNTDVIKAVKQLSNLRIERDKVLYDDTTGLFVIVQAAKAYLRSIFDVNSSEYKQITNLTFTNSKK
jgi:hypothetical protein